MPRPRRSTTVEAARARRYYEANREAILARRKAEYDADPGPKKEAARRTAERLRVEMIAAYGGACACCGETTREFLTLDHVGGGGNRHRALLGGKNQAVIRELKRKGWPSEGFRLLCANCNQATSWGRTCPHEKARVHA